MTATTDTITIPTHTFYDAVLTDEGPFPCYLVWLTAERILELMQSDTITLDPTYQRGKTTPTKRAPSLPIQSEKRSREHIEGIKQDLMTVTPEHSRNLAIIPPIWLNARQAPGNIASVFFKPSVGVGDASELRIPYGQKLYCFDGWHRLLSIKQATREGQIDSQRKFACYIMAAPLATEARAFRILNSMGLPVKEARIAWVSAPFSEDWVRIAWEFAYSNPHWRCGEDWNFEQNKSTVSVNSPYYCGFLAISNGFNAAPNTNVQNWVSSGLDPSSPKDRALVMNFMNAYWDELVRLCPTLSWQSVEGRRESRSKLPFLLNNLMVQVLVWLGFSLLRAYRGGSVSVTPPTLRERLKDLMENPAKMHFLLSHLAPLKQRNLWAYGSRFWTRKGLVKANGGSWIRNDFSTRRMVWEALRDHLGLQADSLRYVPPAKTQRPLKESNRKMANEASGS